MFTWLQLPMITAAFVLHLGNARGEEWYLDRKFGGDFRRYRALAAR